MDDMDDTYNTINRIRKANMLLDYSDITDKNVTFRFSLNELQKAFKNRCQFDFQISSIIPILKEENISSSGFTRDGTTLYNAKYWNLLWNKLICLAWKKATLDKSLPHPFSKPAPPCPVYSTSFVLKKKTFIKYSNNSNITYQKINEIDEWYSNY